MKLATTRHQTRLAFKTLTRKSDPIPVRVSSCCDRYSCYELTLTTQKPTGKATNREDGDVHSLTADQEPLVNRIVPMLPECVGIVSDVAGEG